MGEQRSHWNEPFWVSAERLKTFPLSGGLAPEFTEIPDCAECSADTQAARWWQEHAEHDRSSEADAVAARPVSPNHAGRRPKESTKTYPTRSGP
jgi:hypothetical protein